MKSHKDGEILEKIYQIKRGETSHLTKISYYTRQVYIMRAKHHIITQVHKASSNGTNSTTYFSTELRIRRI
jgi:hypothetical protein